MNKLGNEVLPPAELFALLEVEVNNYIRTSLNLSPAYDTCFHQNKDCR